MVFPNHGIKEGELPTTPPPLRALHSLSYYITITVTNPDINVGKNY